MPPKPPSGGLWPPAIPHESNTGAAPGAVRERAQQRNRKGEGKGESAMFSFEQAGERGLRRSVLAEIFVVYRGRATASSSTSPSGHRTLR
jgi:hypothetical protein